MNNYRNLNRPGVRSSTTVDPKTVLEDIDNNVRKLYPEDTPLQVITSYLGNGPKPKSHKIQVKQYHAFDPWDWCSKVELGSTLVASGGWERYALITLDQVSRPDVASELYYFPQDSFWIERTGQKVMVVCSPTGSIRDTTNSYMQFPTALTGNTATRTSAGKILVKTVEPYAFKPFTTSDVVYLGRTIFESQNIEAESSQRDYVFDCNFVEHKEKVLIFTEDQKNLVQVEGSVPDFTMNQEELIREFKQENEHMITFSEREVDLTIPARPMRHMRGLIPSIRTNVAYYNPQSITDMETMFGNFLLEQAFRWNPVSKSKIALCGQRFLFNFNQAFKDYRQTGNGIQPAQIGKEMGLDINSYNITGHKVSLVTTDMFKRGTPLENWCVIFDPALAEKRMVKEYVSREFSGKHERDYKIAWEWQGTVAWHLEQANALLRTA